MIEIYAQTYNGQPASAELRSVFGADGGTLGRSSDNRLPLPDPARYVSRVQGRVRWDGTRFWIANVSDANPMFLNDEEIEAKRERPLAPGDELRVGLYVLRVRAAGEHAIEYHPAPPGAQRLSAALIEGGSIDALLGVGTGGASPFEDLLGGSRSPPHTPVSSPEMLTRYAEAPEPNRNAPRLIDPGVPLANNPFADLLGSSSASVPLPNPVLSHDEFPPGALPDDFDPFAAQPSPRARSNSDDPLRELLASSADLGGVADAPKSSLVDFEPAPQTDPGDPLRGGTPSLVDSLQAVDPLHLFGTDDGLLQPIREEALAPDAMPQRDNLPLIDSSFKPARAIPDTLLPPAQAVSTAVAWQTDAPPPEATRLSSPASPERDALALPVANGSPSSEMPFDNPPYPRASASSESPVEAAPPKASPTSFRGVGPDAIDLLVDAFLEGVGVPGLPKPATITPDTMRELGALVYQAVAGTMGLIAARQITKREIGAELTMIVATRNNPLKFLPTPEAMLMQLLGPRMPGFMAPVDAMASAFEDLRAHEVGVIAGTRAAFAEVLRRFDPKLLDERVGQAGALQSLMPALRRAKLWELFVATYEEVYRDAQDNFESLYGLAFIKAYEEEVRRNRSTRSKT